MVNFHFLNESTQNYCSDKFDIDYDVDRKNLKVSPKNTTDILQNHEELELCEQTALEAYREAFQNYNSHEIAFCFDGGKDGHVVFHLLKNFLLQHENTCNQQNSTNNNNSDSSKILVVNIIQDSQDLLAEPLALVKTITEKYSNYLSYQEYTNLDIKSALYRLKDDHCRIKAIFMGVRRTDNVWYKDMKVFQKTDKGWPEYVRINPILDWSYPCVWAYLLKYDLKYCNLYDEGYTSLGKKSNSIRNEHLRVDVQLENNEKTVCYRWFIISSKRSVRL